MAGDRKDGEEGLLETYGLPLWFYPVFILAIILFGVCTELDPDYGKSRVFQT